MMYHLDWFEILIILGVGGFWIIYYLFDIIKNIKEIKEIRENDKR